MSADGSVEIQVSAEGAEGAADDLADASEAGVTGGGRQTGGLSQTLRGGLLGGALVSALGPLLDVLNPMLDLLKAFLAPIAVVFLRLAQPVFRWLLQLLPAWFRFVDDVGRALDGIDVLLATLLGPLGLLLSFVRNQDLRGVYIEWIGKLMSSIGELAGDLTSELAGIPSAIWTLFSDGWSWLSEGAWNIAKDVWSFVSRLPAQIGQEIGERVPGVPSADDAAGAGDDLIEGGNRWVDRQTNVNIMGGLEAFIDRIERSSNIDLP